MGSWHVGYPALQHVGYPVSVLVDGTDTGATPLRDNGGVIGWRSGCDCGWRGRQSYPRAEWPSSTGAVPAAVDGWDNVTATCGEWVHHLRQAVPELSIYELGRQLTDTGTKLTAAVALARRAGLSWAQIGDAAGISADHAARRWGRGVRGEHPSTSRSADHWPRPDTGPTRLVRMDQSTVTTPQLYRLPDMMRLLSLSRSVIYEQIRVGRLRSVTQGRTRLIPASAIAEYITCYSARPTVTSRHKHLHLDLARRAGRGGAVRL